jgi:hypothetical protein
VKAKVEIGQDGVVEISVEFNPTEREFGKWRWNVQFMLAREVKDDDSTLYFGICDPKEGFLFKCAPDEGVKFIKALLDEGKYRSITHMPDSPLGQGYLRAFPNPEVKTIRAATANTAIVAARKFAEFRGLDG